MQTTKTVVALTSGKRAECEPLKLLKRIGSTTFEVTIWYSKSATETLEDKIL